MFLGHQLYQNYVKWVVLYEKPQPFYEENKTFEELP